MAEEETAGLKAEPEVQKGPGKGPSKGKGKGPSGPLGPKGKSKGKEAAAVPSWQKPDISSEWQVERMVNWQPIRQTSRLEGSVWQQVHDSLDGQAAKLPENLLERFMRKVSDVPQAPKRSSEANGLKKAAAPTKRLLSSKQGLVADIHHALLTRKGFRTMDDLTWLLGPPKEEEHVLGEEVLEALQGLLGAAVGEERSLTAAGQATKDGVASEVFLRQLLEREPLQELQLRVQLNLDMARFHPKANDLESGLDLALTAAWTIIDSKAMPVLLEGILLLGNSVNAASKNLGCAVGVTLDSLTKLAHTRCLPAKQVAGGKRKSSNRVESALEVLALHLDQANQGFIANLISDLDACHSAKDFDHKLMAGLVQELAEQVGQVRKHLRLHPDSQAPCIQAERLQSFLAEADARIQHLQTCLEEIDEATVSLRQWFAEPASSSLHDMLRALAALRKLLPAPKQSDIPPPQDYRLSATRKRRLEEKAQAAKEVKASEAPGCPQIPEANQPEDRQEETQVEKAEDNSTEKTQEDKPDEQDVQGEPAVVEAPQTPLVGSLCEVAAPSGVLPQILSWSKGTIWISWLFDWADVHRGFAEASERICAFEVMQFSSDCASLSQAELNSRPAASRWRCPTAPLKMDVPLGCHYVFAVRAILVKGGNLEDAEMLWASSISSPVTLDLRYSTSSSPSVAVEKSPEISPKETSVEKSPTTSPRRGRGASGRVASGIGEFLSSGGSPGRRLSLRPTASPRASAVSLEVPIKEEARSSEPVQAGSPKMLAETPRTMANPSQDISPLPESSEAVAAGSKSKEDDSTAETETPASGLSLSSSSPQDFDAIDDESLLRLAQACTFLEAMRTPKPLRTDEASFGPLEGPAAETLAAPSEPRLEGPTKGPGIAVPRAPSIFDDVGTLESMADMLCRENVSLEAQLEPPATGSQLGIGRSSAIVEVDGAEVLAEMERQFKLNKKCESCNGTGYVGLFGAQGFGVLQRKCTSCSN